LTTRGLVTAEQELGGGFTPLLQLFERLALLGYSFDLAKWELWVTGGLLAGVPPLPSNDCQIPRAVEDRVRRMLDVERRLAPGSSVDKLAFYLVVAGLDDIPPALIADYMEAGLSKFFVVGEGMLRRLERKPERVGPLAERKLADAMSRAVLRDYPLLGAASYTAHQQLLATCFMIFFRTSWCNRPPRADRRFDRIITPGFLDYQRLPVKSIALADTPADQHDAAMPPAADKDRLFVQLRIASETSSRELLQAVKDAAMVIRTATTQFPELEESEPLPSPTGAFAQWVLTLIPPVLAAALYRVSQYSATEKYGNLIPNRKETGLEAILRTALVYWHT
jgi:hypothetical protein